MHSILKTGTACLTIFVLFPAISLGAPKSKKPLLLIEKSGEILGVSIGMTLEQAHKKLDRLRPDGLAKNTTQKEIDKGERYLREVWQLKSTDYQWIMVWANKDGNIRRVAASLRPEHYKPFEEIGDVGRAASKNAFMAVWDVKRPSEKSFRVMGKGAGNRAWIIYLFALEGEEIEQED